MPSIITTTSLTPSLLNSLPVLSSWECALLCLPNSPSSFTLSLAGRFTRRLEPTPGRGVTFLDLSVDFASASSLIPCPPPPPPLRNVPHLPDFGHAAQVCAVLLHCLRHSVPRAGPPDHGPRICPHHCGHRCCRIRSMGCHLRCEFHFVASSRLGLSDSLGLLAT